MFDTNGRAAASTRSKKATLLKLIMSFKMVDLGYLMDALLMAEEEDLVLT